ncbi:MAG TPA: uracil-DNA glycosylase [Anaerolineaceae bacterium]|nr:uracil-DNA glycosylase [Anaerolineaceae bacterium]
MEPAEILQQVAEEVSVCTKCPLYHSRKKAVPGEGPANAEILFIGEGPGYYENEQGRPFVGAAGKFLDELLASIHLKRGDVFITNVVKCRPPGNRDPEPAEVTTCTTNYLERQIAAIQPEMIVTLGRHSMGEFLPNAKITKVHGKPAWVNGKLIVPMFHPAAALHQPALRASVVADFSHLPQWIEEMKKSGPPPEPPPEKTDSEDPDKPSQLSLF